ncbi:MAG: hypothetical protein ATN34_00510 [Epulopiscium sp. Nele67-Bin002]|nr:MAG: hypothetical protein BEN18_06485 [Epulopiscium sp. Nuni2H_MBin001]OON91170.1 MAG: hypothetical protein ATN34_00510 [Epulopiscium sp. Nele67-Bin002]OON93861.1 MAG: hypothetical protein ATN33_05105 [Epulopiscium sp. Nele67-Bin001]
MSRHNFMVINLKDLKVPVIMLGVSVLALGVFMNSGGTEEAKAAEVFAPSTNYKDGIYVANLAFTDANMDLVVQVENEAIVSVSLEGFDETERVLYNDLNSSISFVNHYVVSTQSLELPESENITSATNTLMDAVLVALSSDPTAKLTTTYQPALLEELPDGTLLIDVITDEIENTPLLAPLGD